MVPLAHLDKTCSILLNNHNVAQALLALIKQETDRMRAATRSKDFKKDGIKIMHAIVGALKNLSLAGF